MSVNSKPNKDVISFGAWLEELERIRKFSGYSADAEAFLPAYEDGLTPAEAVLQDLSYL
jgi:hypothetical protein